MIEELELPMTTGSLRENLNVQTSGDSQVFSIVVQDENPYQAADIANTTTEIFQEKIYDIMNVDNVTILTAGTPNTTPASPNKPLNLVIGVLLGLMAGIGIVFIRELTNEELVTVTVLSLFDDEDYSDVSRIHRKHVR